MGGKQVGGACFKETVFMTTGSRKELTGGPVCRLLDQRVRGPQAGMGRVQGEGEGTGLEGQHVTLRVSKGRALSKEVGKGAPVTLGGFPRVTLGSLW